MQTVTEKEQKLILDGIKSGLDDKDTLYKKIGKYFASEEEFTEKVFTLFKNKFLYIEEGQFLSGGARNLWDWENSIITSKGDNWLNDMEDILNNKMEDSRKISNNKDDNKNPKAFVSYSQDNDEFKNWVRCFVDRLIGDGVDTKLDQYDLTFGSMNPYFMENSISESDFVILLITENYTEKANERKGGVGYEVDLVAGEIVLNKKRYKYIPVLIGIKFDEAPMFVRGAFAIRIANLNNYDEEYIQIYAHLTGQKLYKKPSLGNIRKIDEMIDEKKNDYIKEKSKLANLENYSLWTVNLKINNYNDKHISELFPIYQKYFLKETAYYGVRYYPYVINSDNKQSHGDEIIYETIDLTPDVVNVKTFERLIMKDNEIVYNELEFTDSKYLMVSTNISCSTILYILIFLKRLFESEKNEPNISIDFTLESNIERIGNSNYSYLKSWPPSIDVYKMKSKRCNFSFIFLKIDFNTILDFYKKLFGIFVSDNVRSENPFYRIDRAELAKHYNSAIQLKS